MIIHDNSGKNSLMTALKNRDFCAAKSMIASGMCTRESGLNGGTPLVRAIRLAPYEIVVSLLQQGALNSEHWNRTNMSALMHAAKHSRLKVVNVLLEFGADPAQINKDGKTALDLATDPRIQEVLRKVLES